MSTLQITWKMASVRECSSDVSINLRDQLGDLVLKEEQKLGVEALSRKRCNGLSSQWFREIHYLSKLRLCQHGLDCGCCSVSQYFPRPVAVKRLWFKSSCLQEDPTIIKRHLCQQVQCNLRIRAEQALSAEFTAGCFKMILTTAFQLS